MEKIEFLITLMFAINISILGVLAYTTLRERETYKKEVEELRDEVERLKRNLTLS